MKFYYPGHENPTVTIDLPGELFPVEREYKRWQDVGVAEDGSVKVYDKGVEEVFYIISLGPLTDVEMENLESFIRDTVKFRLNPFEIEGYDGLIRVRYWEDIFKKEERVYKKFWVKFKVRQEI